MADANSSLLSGFATVVSTFVTAWQDPAQLFVAEDLAATRQRATRFALAMFVLSYAAAAIGLGVIGLSLGQLGVFGPIAIILLVSGPILSTLLWVLESAFVRLFGPQPVSGQGAWDLAVAGVGFAQATLPLMIVPFVGLPLGLLLGARIIVSGLKKLGAQSGERAWLSAMVALGLPTLLSLFVRTSVIETYRQPSSGMHPTLLPGDLVLATKFDYGIRLPGKTDAVSASLPQLGDVVVFSKSEEQPALFIKRVVGLPGDRIELRDGALWRNGQPVSAQPGPSPCEYREIEEKQPPPGVLHKCRSVTETLGNRSYVASYDDPALTQQTVQPVEVGPGQVYLLGDNRDNSHDSRHFGPIAASRVTGRIRYVLWSFSPSREFRKARTFLALP
jgi:signal peptidase I